MKQNNWLTDLFINTKDSKIIVEQLTLVAEKIGGMPKAVNSRVNEKDIEKGNYIQQNILNSYESDFSKHTDNTEANKISLI